MQQRHIFSYSMWYVVNQSTTSLFTKCPEMMRADLIQSLIMLSQKNDLKSDKNTSKYNLVDGIYVLICKPINFLIPHNRELWG